MGFHLGFLLFMGFHFGFFLFMGFHLALVVLDIIDKVCWRHTSQKPHLVSLEVEPHGIRHLRLIFSFALPRFSCTRKPHTAIHTPKKKPWVPPVAPALTHITEMMSTAVIMTLAPHHLVVDQPPSLLQPLLQLQLCTAVNNLRHHLARQTGLHCVGHNLSLVSLSYIV